MELINKKATLEYFGAPGPEELETWCQQNNYGGVFPTQDDQHEGMPSDHVLAAALWHARTKFPNAETLDICSYAGLVTYLATGWYGGFGTDQYQKERQAEHIVLSLAGGIAPEPDGMLAYVPSQEPDADFTKKVLEFLDGFYFGDAENAVIKAIEDVDPIITARAILALARNRAEYENLVRVADRFLKKKTNISSLRQAVRKVLGTTSK